MRSLTRCSSLVVAGSVFGVFAVLLPAQVMPEYKEPEKQFTINTAVDVVLLDVSVKDPKGGFASALKQDNFKVFEDGKPETITSFTSYDTPVTVGLVVDNSGSMRLKRADTVTAALTFAKESNPLDEMFVVNFNDVVRMGLPEGMDFTSDNVTLRSALLNNPVAGQTALYDALIVAIGQLDKGRRTKKTLVLISDGGDNRSQHTLNDVIEAAQKSTATIYSIGIYDPEDKDANPNVLKKLSMLTGGDYFFPKISTQIVEDCRKIAKDIRNRYTIGYTVSNTTYDNKVRKLRVDASDPERGKLIVKTRTSYIARPHAAAPAPAVTQSRPPAAATAAPATAPAATSTPNSDQSQPVATPPAPSPQPPVEPTAVPDAQPVVPPPTNNPAPPPQQ